MVNKDLQICFITTTQYQFMIADIYARYIYERYKINSVVFIRKFESFDVSKFETDGKYRLIPYEIDNRNLIGQCIFALKCGYFYSFMEWSKVLDKSKRIILFVFTDCSKLTSRLISESKKYDKSNVVVLVEEGNNTYSVSTPELYGGFWTFKHKLSKLLFGMGRTSKVIGDDPLIEAAIVKHPDRYTALEKARNQKIIQQNQDILLSSGDFIKHYAHAETQNYTCDLLYLGQPFYANGKYFKEENECIAEIFNAMPKDLRILIKPHPRDVRNKYSELEKTFPNVSVISDDLAVLPIEAIVGLTNVKVCAAIESSAVVTLANLFPELDGLILREIPEVKKFLNYLRSAGGDLLDLTEDIFVGKNNNVYKPQSFQELCEMTVNAQKKESLNHSILTNSKASFNEIDEVIQTGLAR